MLEKCCVTLPSLLEFVLGVGLMLAFVCGGWTWSSADNTLYVHFSDCVCLYGALPVAVAPSIGKAWGCSETQVQLALFQAMPSFLCSTPLAFTWEA